MVVEGLAGLLDGGEVRGLGEGPEDVGRIEIFDSLGLLIDIFGIRIYFW